MSGDTVIKFQGGQCHAAQCGSKNPLVAAMAASLLQEMNSFNVAHAAEAGAQAVGNIMRNSGINLG